MVFQIGLQGRMVLDEVAVIDERRISAKLFGDFWMAVEEVIEIRQFLAVTVTISVGGRGFESVLALHEESRVGIDLCTKLVMIFEEFSQIMMLVQIVLVGEPVRMGLEFPLDPRVIVEEAVELG